MTYEQILLTVLIFSTVTIMVYIVTERNKMDALKTAIDNLQSKVTAVEVYVNTLKNNQVDPTALSSAVTSINASADALAAIIPAPAPTPAA